MNVKPPVLVGLVGGVFITGLFIGSQMGDRGEARPADVARRGSTRAAAPTGPIALPDNSASGAMTNNSGGARAPARSGFQPREVAGSTPAALPPAPKGPVTAPPSIDPEALAEGERIAQALEKAKGSRGGRVTTLTADFKNKEEQQAWENQRKESWLRRLNYENEIRLKTMRDKVGINPSQEAALKELLQAELDERMRLTDLFAKKQLSLASFRELAQKNFASANAKLADLLSPEQLKAYQALDPREQVLRDDIK